MADLLKSKTIPLIKNLANSFADAMCLTVYFPKFIRYCILTNIMTVVVFFLGLYTKTHAISEFTFYSLLLLFGFLVFKMTKSLIMYYIEDASE